MSSLEKLEIILFKFGLSEEDINYLLAQFLEEEAELYIDCMKSLKNTSCDVFKS